MFFEVDALHRGFVQVTRDHTIQSAVFSPFFNSRSFDLEDPPAWASFFRFVQDGLWHIWTGYDHLLFLAALLIPAVLNRTEFGWRPVTGMPVAAGNVAKIVTSFTVAHSLTFALAALHLVAIPSRLVEILIAASIVIAAVHNLVPLFRGPGWLVAFGFGLIHGFGFAGALGGLGLVWPGLLPALVGFNSGVELGQLAVVAAFLPLAYFCRKRRIYRRLTLRWGSTAIAALALFWFGERLCGVELFPF